MDASPAIPAKVSERTQMLRDTVCTAIEGGINYWADIGKCEYGDEKRLDYKSAVITERETGKTFTLTPRAIDGGLHKIAQGKVRISDDLRRACVVMFHAPSVAEPADAELADCIVQAAMFGELVYG